MNLASRVAPCLGLSVSLAFASGCGGGGSGSPEDAAEVDAPFPQERGTLTGVISSPSIASDGVTVAGATISLLDAAGLFSTTSDVNGAFSLEIPVGVRHVHVEKTGHWSLIYPVDMTQAGIAAEEMFVLADAFVTEIDGLLSGSIDAAKGMQFVRFNTTNDAGGESATISQPSEGSFAFGTSAPVEGNSLVSGGEEFILFHGVTLGTSLVTVTGAASINACVNDFVGMEWPVRAKTVTFSPATCTPF
jgi:hypothetical protein